MQGKERNAERETSFSWEEEEKKSRRNGSRGNKTKLEIERGAQFHEAARDVAINISIIALVAICN